jgi:hypothetical protein
MPVILQGSLRHFVAKDLLAFLANAQSGTFDAESAGVRLRVALRDGHVLWADGNDDAAGVVAKLIGWRDGTFTFLDEVTLPDGAAPLDQEISALIDEAEKRNAEAQRMTSLFPDENIRFRVVNRPPGEINITAEEFQLLFQIGGGKSLAQLRVDSGRNADDLDPIIKRLQMTGLLEPIADPELTPREAVARPKPAPPSPSAPAGEPVPATERGVARRPTVESDLVATLTADDGTLHPLLEETSTIGRTAANTIALRDVSVSAKHAVVVRSAEGFVIEDVGSRNGTYVNSEKLTEKRLLADGDLVRLGKIILTFNLASDIQKKQSTEREMMK